MPRNPDTIVSEIWASDPAADVQSPTAAGIDESGGWPQSYSQTGGDNPTRELDNWWKKLITAIAVELNTGLMEWDAAIAYNHPSLTRIGTQLYWTIQDSTGENPSDVASLFWKPVINTADGAIAPPPLATAIVHGLMRFATETQGVDPAVENAAMSPAVFHRSLATTERPGTVELGDQDETNAGTDSSRVPSLATLDGRRATDTLAGLAERATNAEMDDGTDDERFATPAGVKRVVDALTWTGTQAQFDALSSTENAVIYMIHE